MANYKYLQHTADELDAAVEQQRQHCNASDLHVCAEDKEALAGCVSDVAALKNVDGITRTTLGAQCKNLLKCSATTETKNGVTFTINDDGTVTLNGTSTQEYNFYYGMLQVPGSYRLNGYPENPDLTLYRLMGQLTKEDGTTAWFGNVLEQSFKLGLGSGNKTVKVYIKIYADKTYENVVFSPMIRDADATDSTYEPYAPSLQAQLDALTTRIAALEVAAGTASVASMSLDDPSEPVAADPLDTPTEPEALTV
jgi:hypothetical protein